MSDCIRACIAPRRHVFVDGEGRACPDDCPGCLPRLAEYGHLCHACRIKELLIVPVSGASIASGTVYILPFPILSVSIASS